MVGLSRDEGALDRLVTTVHHLAALVDQYLDRCPKNSRSSARKEHYQLQGSMIVRSQTISQNLQLWIELHCGCNPFKERTLLKSLVSSTLVSKEAKNYILQFAELGQKRYEEFVSECLKLTSKLSVWDKMKKMNLKAFSNWMEKKKVQVGDKVIKLREECELLGRFLIIQDSRPHLVRKFEETIGKYEIVMVPRSLCAGDRTLLLTADKANLMKALEDVTSQSLQDIQQDFIEEDLTQNDSIEEADATIQVLIIDAMAVLQCMKKATLCKHCRIFRTHLTNAFKTW